MQTSGSPLFNDNALFVYQRVRESVKLEVLKLAFASSSVLVLSHPVAYESDENIAKVKQEARHCHVRHSVDSRYEHVLGCAVVLRHFCIAVPAMKSFRLLRSLCCVTNGYLLGALHVCT